MLPDSLFEGLTLVETLQLQSNHLTELPEGIFNDLVSLRQLVLTGNALIRISPGLFIKYSIQLSIIILFNGRVNSFRLVGLAIIS